MTAMLDPGTVARQWWHETFGRDDAGARTARAQLRRCATVLEVLTVESPHRLSQRLRRHGSHTTPGQIAVMALGLAHIREPGTRPIARVFGEGKTPQAPPSSAGDASTGWCGRRRTRRSSRRCARRWESSATSRSASSRSRETSTTGMRRSPDDGATSTTASPT